MKLIYRIKQLMLIGGDFLSFVAGFWFSLAIRKLNWPVWEDIEKHLTLFFFLFLIWLVINYINGLYDLNRLKNNENARHFLESGLISLLISIIFFYILPSAKIAPKTILLLNIIIGYGISSVWRLVYNCFIGPKSLYTNIIFIGYTKETQELIDIIQNNPNGGYKIKALIDPENKVKPADLPFFDVYHSVQAIRPAITNHHAQMAVIAPHLRQDDAMLSELYELLFWSVRISDLPSFYEVITGRITPSIFSEAWFLENLKNSSQPIYEKLRTGTDIIVGIIIGAVFIVILPILALLIKLTSKGPVFYKQTRVGQNGKIFNLFKLRSMYSLSKDGGAETGGYQFATRNDKRITSIGKFLRKSRLDELPQFLNLLKRDITLIGPRPERPEIVKKLTADIVYYPLRHIVKPGLTSWAVIHQNYTDNLEKSKQKLQYDLYYIKNRSLLLDISIILRTINIVFRMMGQ